MSEVPNPSSAATATPDCRVHFVPKWPGNPYHAELDRHLRACGVTVEDEDRLIEISKHHCSADKRPDVVHVHALPLVTTHPRTMLRYAMFWLRLRRLRRLGVRVVWTIHDIFHHEARFPRVELAFCRMFHRSADAVIVHSAAAGRAVERQWSVRRTDGVFVIPHGNYLNSYPNRIDRIQAREKLGVPAGKLVYLFLGLIRPYKGVTRLVREFKTLPEDRVHLLIAGKPINDTLSAEIAGEIGGRSNIGYLPGFVADDEVQDFMNAADVVVFPYTRALTSGALILAMSFGRACIAPKMGALEDTLDEGGGFLFEPEERDSLRTSLHDALANDASLPAMGAHNLARAKQWGWDEVARLTAEVYRGEAS
jgi:beta-1,4-mannosyltransferase